MKRAIVFLSISLSCLYIAAQSCCSGGVPMAANLGLPSVDKGVWQIAATYDLNILNTLMANEERLDDDARRRLTHSWLVNLGYTFHPRWSVEGFLSFIRQERRITQFGNEDFTKTEGLGDAALLLKYHVLPLTPNTLSLQIGAGIKAPTGPSDQRREDGIILNADLQPGSGSWDGLLWGRASYPLPFRPSATLSLITTINLRGSNPSYLGTQRYAIGDDALISLAWADRFIWKKGLIDPSLALRYRYAAKDEVDKLKVADTGGNWLFIVPGTTYTFSPKVAAQVQIALPIYSSVNGTQLSPSSRITASIYYQIIPKKKNLTFQPK